MYETCIKLAHLRRNDQTSRHKRVRGVWQKRWNNSNKNTQNPNGKDGDKGV